jgi:hypothetical protein
MLKRRDVLAVVALVLGIGVTDAEAQWFRGWLDRLSGPGGFEGQGVQLSFLCYARRSPPPDVKPGPIESRRELFVDLDCGRAHRDDETPIVIGVEAGWYDTDRNELSYAGDPPRELRRITYRTLVPTADVQVLQRTLEFGAGVGVGWFDGELFGTTSKLVVPLRVTAKPVAWPWVFAGRRAPEWTRILQGRLIGTLFPGGFDAADFGAIPGSWESGAEIVPAFHLVFDFGELLWR